MGELKTLIESFVKKEGRTNETQGHKDARRFLCSALEKLGLDAYGGDSFELPYGKPGQDFVNVVARRVGSNRKLKPNLIAAHYDTCGMLPGADDNASSVCLLLRLIKLLKDKPLARDLVFAFFDAEEPPYFLQPAMGSIRFYEDQLREPINLAVVLDMVGHDTIVPGMESGLFLGGLESDPFLSSLLEDSSFDELPVLPLSFDVVGSVSDYHIFHENTVPYIFLTSGRWLHYHSPTDTPEKLNYHRLELVENFVLNLLINADEHCLTGPFGSCSTFIFQIKRIKKFLKQTLVELKFELNSKDELIKFEKELLHRYRLWL